jgi:glycogen synthase
VPVVRRTGGLADTVFDVDDDGERAADAGHIPNGFAFDGTDSNALDYALNRRVLRVSGRPPTPEPYSVTCWIIIRAPAWLTQATGKGFD